jgi:hypothetical protein
VTHRVDDDEHGDHEEPRRVGDQHQRSAVVAIGERAAHEHRREEPDSLQRQDEPKRASRAGEREGPPAERHDEGRVAEQRDRLTGPEQAEVAAPERMEDAGARGCGCGHLHGPKAILSP